LPSGYELSGLILRADNDTSYVARYTIRLDKAWATEDVTVELEDGGRRKTHLMRDAAGSWSRDGQAVAGFEACTDVDLEWSPSTNTLPIRRLRLAPGDRATVSAAWVHFPSLVLERLDQSYERIAQYRYRYRSGRFVAEIEVDDESLVLRYGESWKAVARTGES
jgi:hypothetical protein